MEGTSVEGGAGDPGSHLLARKGLLDPARQLEEEDVLDPVAVEETARRVPGEPLLEPGGAERVEEASSQAEREGAERGGGRTLQLREEGIGGPEVDLLDVAGPLLRANLLDEAHVVATSRVLPLECPRHPCATRPPSIWPVRSRRRTDVVPAISIVARATERPRRKPRLDSGVCATTLSSGNSRAVLVELRAPAPHKVTSRTRFDPNLPGSGTIRGGGTSSFEGVRPSIP